MRVRLMMALLLAVGLTAASPPPDLHPTVKLHEKLILPTAPRERGELRVRFLGVSTLLFDDGTTAILLDGFFSRPSNRQLVKKIEPDSDKINYALTTAEAPRLDAVLVAHSHYDHAMDSAAIAKRDERTLLIGSKSTAFIGEGAGLPPDRMCEVAPGDTFALGEFRISIIESKHGFPNLAPGSIKSKLSPPARVWKYKEGGSLSFLIEHRGLRMLVSPSAGFRRDAIRAVEDVDVVFLAIGGPGFGAKTYWREVVSGTGAQLIVPIHWDNFRRPIDEPLKPMRRFDSALKKLIDRADDEGRKVRLMAPFLPVDVGAAAPDRWRSRIAGPRPGQCPRRRTN